MTHIKGTKYQLAKASTLFLALVVLLSVVNFGATIKAREEVIATKQQLNNIELPTTCYVNYRVSKVATHEWKGTVTDGSQ